jgi:hypothetical protein
MWVSRRASGSTYFICHREQVAFLDCEVDIEVRNFAHGVNLSAKKGKHLLRGRLVSTLAQGTHHFFIAFALFRKHGLVHEVLPDMCTVNIVSSTSGQALATNCPCTWRIHKHVPFVRHFAVNESFAPLETEVILWCFSLRKRTRSVTKQKPV